MYWSGIETLGGNFLKSFEKNENHRYDVFAQFSDFSQAPWLADTARAFGGEGEDFWGRGGE